MCGRQCEEERVENDRKDYPPLEGIATIGSGHISLAINFPTHPHHIPPHKEKLPKNPHIKLLLNKEKLPPNIRT